MSNEELLTILKAGLMIPTDYMDSVLLQKGLAVKTYLLDLNVTEENLNTELGHSVLCIGVTDLMNLAAGEIKFSPAFASLIEHLIIKGLE